MAKEYTAAAKELDETPSGSDYSFRVEQRKDGEGKMVTSRLCYVAVRATDGSEVPTAGQWSEDVLTPAELEQLETILDLHFVAATSGDDFQAVG